MSDHHEERLMKTNDRSQSVWEETGASIHSNRIQ